MSKLVNNYAKKLFKDISGSNLDLFETFVNQIISCPNCGQYESVFATDNNIRLFYRTPEQCVMR